MFCQIYGSCYLNERVKTELCFLIRLKNFDNVGNSSVAVTSELPLCPLSGTGNVHLNFAILHISTVISLIYVKLLMVTS